MDQHYYKLIEDYNKKKINSEDLADLMSWVAFSDQNQQTFREVLKSYELAEQALRAPVNQQKSWLAIQQHINQQVKADQPKVIQLKRRNWLKLVAAIVILSALPLLYFSLSGDEQQTEIAYSEIYNPKGQKRLVTMPDGSNIFLNGDTKIRYAQNFNSGKRIVYLEGEAFFDVQHLPEQPFIVYTGKVATTVLGTSFNINAYRSLNRISVTVQSGKVGVVVNNHKGKKVHFLLPNQQINITADGITYNRKVVNANEVDGWREYKMVFYDQTLQEIAAQMEREYDLEISIKGATLKQTKITTKFSKSSVIDILDMIAKLTNSKYKIDEKRVIIY